MVGWIVAQKLERREGNSMSKTKTDSGDCFYTAYITLKNGKRLYAAQYGLKAFCIPKKETKKK